MGRPITLDDLKARRIVDAVRAGASRAEAAEAAGVGRSTLLEWLARGRDGEQPFAEFLDRVTGAQGSALCHVASKLMERIDEGNVPAIMFFLERRGAAEWGKKDTVAHVDGPVPGEDRADDLEVARSVVAALESRKVA